MNLVNTDLARTPTATGDAAPVVLLICSEVPNLLPSVLSSSSHLFLPGGQNTSKNVFLLRVEQGLLSVLAVWGHDLLHLQKQNRLLLAKKKP